jgi:3'-5' exoribonuclease
MIKIRDMEVGKSYSTVLVVISATARETRAKKPYLALELYDGTDKINSNFWDWAGKVIPEKNSILNVNAQLTEYLGTPQLNIKSMTTNSEHHISEFTPNSGVDIGATYLEAYEMASNVTDDFLRDLTLTILDQLKHLWVTVPGANTIHHAYTAGTLIHSVSVAKIAKAVAETIPGTFIELATVGGLLHDIGKLFGYRINGIVCEMTDEGLLYEHTFLGAQFINNFAEENNLLKDEKDEAKLELLCHIILSHHGKREYGAAVPPSSIEAHIVHQADALDAAAEQIRVESSKTGRAKWTERIWALENRPHITTQYTNAVYHNTEETV